VPKTKRSIKPEVTKAAVITRAVLGQTKTQIANDLKMSRDTVRAILSEADFSQILADTKADTYELLPEGVKHIKHELVTRKPGAGFRLLEGVGILNPRKDEAKEALRDVTIVVVYDNSQKTIEIAQKA